MTSEILTPYIYVLQLSIKDVVEDGIEATDIMP